MHRKKRSTHLNEANQKNPKLMSRLEIISQNLFWLGVAALTCQTRPGAPGEEEDAAPGLLWR